MSDVEKLEEERDHLKRELVGVQEMLAFVLYSVGEPVTVKKAALKKGLPEGTQIAIDDSADSFVFSLAVVE